ncbi:MAG: hypothetical protein JOZ32_17880 [Bryobacterales bacterium]|nr:hypothetical protein [Bryobacterales bacterium]
MMTEHDITPERRCGFCGFGPDGRRKFFGLSLSAADGSSLERGYHQLCDACLRVMMMVFAVRDRAGFNRAIEEAQAQASAVEATAHD